MPGFPFPFLKQRWSLFLLTRREISFGKQRFLSLGFGVMHQCATTCPAGQGSSSRISLGCLGEELAKILKCGAQRGGLGTCDGSEPAQHRRGTSHVSQELVQVLIAQAIPLLLRGNIGLPKCLRMHLSSKPGHQTTLRE